MSYTIKAETLERGHILIFTNVSDYSIDNGGFVKFIDSRNGKEKIFHSSRVEIERVN